MRKGKHVVKQTFAGSQKTMGHRGESNTQVLFTFLLSATVNSYTKYAKSAFLKQIFLSSFKQVKGVGLSFFLSLLFL